MFIHPKLLKYKTYRTEGFEFVSSVKQNQRGSWWKAISVAEVAMPAGSKPPAAVGERISKGERHDLGVAAPLPIRASPFEQEKAGGPVESPPKLVEHIGSGSTRFAEQLSHASLELL